MRCLRIVAAYVVVGPPLALMWVAGGVLVFLATGAVGLEDALREWWAWMMPNDEKEDQ